MRRGLLLLALWSLWAPALDSIRVVVTFNSSYTASAATAPDWASLVKQYGRRMVLSLPDSDASDFYNVTDRLGEHFEQQGSEVVDIELDTVLTSTEIIVTSPLMVQGDALMVQGDAISSGPALDAFWNLFNSTYGLQLPLPGVNRSLGQGNLVAILDSGIATSAYATLHSVASGYDFVSDPSISLDGDGRDGNPTDPGDAGPGCPVSSWHGSKVASVLAGSSSGFYSIAPEVTIVPVRVLGLCASGYASDVSDAIVWSAGGPINGVPANPNPTRIISMSLAGQAPCPSFMQSAVTQALSLGATIVAAAGNSDLNASLFFPANCAGVMPVAASTRQGTLAGYSNWGSIVAVAAPGGDYANPIPVLSPGSGILFAMGTSFSVPHVVGLLALYSNSSVFQMRSRFVSQSVQSFPVHCSGCGTGLALYSNALGSSNMVVALAYSNGCNGAGNYVQITAGAYLPCSCQYVPNTWYETWTQAPNTNYHLSTCAPYFQYCTLDANSNAYCNYLTDSTGAYPAPCSGYPACSSLSTTGFSPFSSSCYGSVAQATVQVGSYTGSCNHLCGGSSYPNTYRQQWIDPTTGYYFETCTPCSSIISYSPSLYALQIASSSCAAGTYGCNPNFCTSCNSVCTTPGQYVTGCGGASAGTCTACGTCTGNQYLNGCGGSSPGTCTACTSCPATGYYTTGCGGTSAGTCTQCTNAVANTYYTSAGGFSNNCNTAACITCSSTQYMTNCGNTYSGQCNNCGTCLPGQYLSGCGGTSAGSCVSCGTCSAGQYLSGCGPGTSAGSCVSCGTCSAGQYLSGCSGTSAGTCVSCGTCSAGQYLSGCSGANAGTCTTCRTCSPGQYLSGCSGANAGTCTACGTCQGGQYLSGCSGANAGTCTTCGTCQGGQYLSGCAGANAGTCTACASCTSTGQYTSGCGGTSGPGACATCTPCTAVGQYTIGCGGTSGPGTCTSCTNAPSSSYYYTSSGGYSNACTYSACTVCVAGKYVQTACGATNDATCTSCTAGSYTTASESSSCAYCNNKPASQSYYIGSGSSTATCPYACNAGYDHSQSCAACGSATYSLAGDTSCSTCTNAPANAVYTSTTSAWPNAACPFYCNTGYTESSDDTKCLLNAVVTNPPTTVTTSTTTTAPLTTSTTTTMPRSTSTTTTTPSFTSTTTTMIRSTSTTTTTAPLSTSTTAPPTTSTTASSTSTAPPTTSTTTIASRSTSTSTTSQTSSTIIAPPATSTTITPPATSTTVASTSSSSSTSVASSTSTTLSTSALIPTTPALIPTTPALIPTTNPPTPTPTTSATPAQAAGLPPVPTTTTQAAPSSAPAAPSSTPVIVGVTVGIAGAAGLAAVLYQFVFKSMIMVPTVIKTAAPGPSANQMRLFHKVKL